MTFVALKLSFAKTRSGSYRIPSKYVLLRSWDLVISRHPAEEEGDMAVKWNMRCSQERDVTIVGEDRGLTASDFL